ncbi:unnamed protein product [Alternaria alternata]
MEQCSPIAAKTETSLAQLSTKLRQRTRVDYQSSVDVDNPVPIDHIANPRWKHGQLCWEARGRCAEDYKSKETKLLKELNQSRRESFSEVAISLFMIGKTPQKAKPMIIISSEDKRSREEAKRAIERSGILEDLNYKIGFLKYLPSGPIHSVAGSPSEVSGVYTADPSSCSPEASDSNSREDATSSSSNQPGFAVSSLAYYNPEQRLRTTAMPIYVKTAADRSRTATANMVYNGTVYKYITVSHVFSPWGASSIDSGEDDLGIPFDSDSEDEDHCNSETSQARGTISASLRVPTSRDSDIDSAKSHRSKISTMHNDSPDTAKDPPSELLRLGELSADDDFDKSADYAIITINDFKLQKQLANLALSNPNRITQMRAAEPKSSQVTAWTRRGAISGTLGNVPRVMRFSGSKRFQQIYEFAYKGVIENGDSGSLVIGESGKELYGMIVAASSSQTIAYVMAAKELIPNSGRPKVRVDHSCRANMGPSVSEMFAILFTDADAHAPNYVTNYNSDLSHLSQSARAKYGELAHAQVRRFIVVKYRREFFFTYNNRATTKPGVRPDEHAIAYSYGCSPQLVAGEQELQKGPIAIVMNADERPLSTASRIYFGIHHPIQYNVKVKDLGYVHSDWMATFSGYWKMEHMDAPEQGLEVTYDPTNHDTN